MLQKVFRNGKMLQRVFRNEKKNNVTNTTKNVGV